MVCTCLYQACFGLMYLVCGRMCLMILDLILNSILYNELQQSISTRVQLLSQSATHALYSVTLPLTCFSLIYHSTLSFIIQ